MKLLLLGSLLLGTTTSFAQSMNINELKSLFTAKKAILEYTSDILENKIKYPRRMVYFIYKQDDIKGLISDMQGYMESLGEDDKKEISKKEFF